MCGILAIFAENDGLVGVDDVLKANTSMRHRGPDDEGYFAADQDGKYEIFGGADSPDYSNVNLDYLPEKNNASENDDHRVFLGHRRLSIIDLSMAGHQPMSYYHGRYWIVYNGEIYNYIEVREELIKLGYNFRSRSDTEVILAAYSQWGSACVNRFNGMWAFVIIDLKGRKAFISRDRFGVKPLYYWKSEKGFIAFASEIKAFTSLPGWESILNHQRAYDFLVWDLMDHTDETLFKNVHQLLSGHNLTFDIDKPLDIKIEPYFEIQDQENDADFESATKKFRSLLEESVKLRMRSDVVVGSCLSGGLDSSSIVVLADSMVKEKDPSKSIQTFSACSDRAEFDESRFVDELVKSRNLASFKTIPDAEGLVSDLEKIIWFQDEPFRTTSIFASWCVFRRAAGNGVKVMLDGQGADEYLAGYEGFIYPRLLGLVKARDFMGLFRELRGLKKNQGIKTSHLVSKVMRRSLGTGNGTSDLIDINRFHIDQTYPIPSNFVKTNEIKQFSKGQLTFSSLPRLLHWEDRNSMAWSVESRVPFLDYRLVQYTVNLPDDLKIKNGIQKVILRKAMNDSLPLMISNRKDKMGFVTPERYWLTDGNPAPMLKLVENAFKSTKGFIKLRVESMIRGMINGTREYEPWAWRFIIFGLWMDIYNVQLEDGSHRIDVDRSESK